MKAKEFIEKFYVPPVGVSTKDVNLMAIDVDDHGNEYSYHVHRDEDVPIVARGFKFEIPVRVIH